MLPHAHLDVETGRWVVVLNDGERACVGASWFMPWALFKAWIKLLDRKLMGDEFSG